MIESYRNSYNPDQLLERQKDRLRKILDFKIDIDSLEDADNLLEKFIDEVVESVNAVRSLYAEKHTEVTDPQIQEDKALEEIGFGNVAQVLDRMNEVRDVLKNKIPRLLYFQTESVITPPDKSAGIQEGSGSGRHELEKGLIPRLKMLLFILLNDCGLEETDVDIKRGSVTDSMLRTEPYVSVYIPKLGRLVIVCDEYGNRTDIFDTRLPEYEALGRERVESLTKDEKNVYGGMHTGSHIALIHKGNWSNKIFSLLTNDLPAKGKEAVLVERPDSFKTYPKIDETNFYTDEKQELWGSATAISMRLSGNAGLGRSSQFSDMLSQIPTRLVSTPKLVPAYQLSEVISRVKTHPELSAWLRKVDESGFWTDEQGQKWGTLRKICNEIDPEESLRRDESFREVINQSNISSKKILYDRVYDGYKFSDIYNLIALHPTYSAYLRRVNEGKFWKDPEGELWSSAYVIATELAGESLYHSERFKTQLNTLESRTILNKIIFPAYKYKDILKMMNNDAELSAWFKKVDSAGLWRDNDGVVWGTARSIAIKLTGEEALYKKSKYKEICKASPTQKLMAGKRIVDGYNLIEIEKQVKVDQDLQRYL